MEERQTPWQFGLGSLQWFIFLLANAVALPIVIGGIYQLPLPEVMELMQRTFFVVGVTSFVQGWIGHRLPIADGPAGSWVAVFTIFADMAIRQGHDLKQTLQILEGGMIMAGLLLIVLGATGVMVRMRKLFTPLVTGSFLLLLGFQLSGVFLLGMLGAHGEPAKADLHTALISFGVFGLVIGLSVWGKGWMRGYAVLLGIIAGWIACYLSGKSGAALPATDWFQLPRVFAWGMPVWDSGMAVAVVLFTLLLVSNTVAAVTAVGQMVPKRLEKEAGALNAGGWAGGIAHLFSAAFSTVGIVPLPASAGFIGLTKQHRLRPFLTACIALSLISLVPAVISKLSLLPGPVANAALMASFVQLIALGLQTITRDALDQRRLTILGVTFLFGVGTMFLPKTIFAQLPSVISYVCGNGLLLGTLIAIALEQVWKKEKEVSVDA
ncbi:purine/pyrimidine permease [Brevibacillus fluminis]|uniref:purine/pyrimidine permease n=1 Tax=Brevibacillus fluminis TaxID=511487 RepID=UPI003F88C664